MLFARHVGVWSYLGPEERDRLRSATARLLATKRWEAASGFALSDQMCTVIAAQAALMALDLGVEVFDQVQAIVVHPTTMTSTAPRPGPVSGVMTDEPVHLLGEAHHRGPVLLAWDAVRRDTRRWGHGMNVVIHELAHKLDMLDGMVDGTPPLPEEQRQRWIDVCTREYQMLRNGAEDPLLRDYAATDTGEFFAVASEVFFDRATAMSELKPDALRDPARLLRLGSGGAPGRACSIRPAERFRHGVRGSVRALSTR